MALQTIAFALCLVLVALAGPATSKAEQPDKLPHLGYLSPGNIPPYDLAFLQGLQEQGYIEPGEIPRYDPASWQTLVKRGFFAGKRIRIDIRTTGQRFEDAEKLAAELVSFNVDVIYAVPAALVKAAQDVTNKAEKPIPIVFALVFDPVGLGFVKSLGNPGGNVTGVANVDPEFEAKQLEVLKETFPRLSRVAYLANPASFPSYVRKAKSAVGLAAQAMGIQVAMLDADSADQLDRALTEIVRLRCQAVIVSQSPLFFFNRARIIEFASTRRLPAFYADDLLVHDGGLMFYGSSIADQKRRSAALVAKILKGAKPADIPVEQPTIYKLSINLKTAKTLGIEIPPSILSRADEVIR